jgi:YVTN family beta-propeller protein
MMARGLNREDGMNLRRSTYAPRGVLLRRALAASAGLALACLVGSAAGFAQNAYITNEGDNTVSVIDTATNTVIGSPIPVGRFPVGVAVTPDGSKVYVTNYDANTVSVIATATNTVIATIPVGFGSSPLGVAVTPDGSKVYVANRNGGTVSVIATANNTVLATIPVGGGLFAFGKFIGPLKFAGTPGFSNCYGQSVSALTHQYGGLKAAAKALGYINEKALKDAIRAFCGHAGQHGEHGQQ